MNDQPIDALDALDQRILDEVRELYARLDPCPAGLTDRIKFALTVQALNADVAELIRSEAPAGVRSEQAGTAPALTGTISFSTRSVTIGISTSEATEGLRRIDGWVTGWPAALIEVHELGSEAPIRTVTADEHGRFVVESVRSGPVFFVVRRLPADPDERPVLTPTFTL